jgi:hypothetical protein
LNVFLSGASRRRSLPTQDCCAGKNGQDDSNRRRLSYDQGHLPLRLRAGQKSIQRDEMEPFVKKYIRAAVLPYRSTTKNKSKRTSIKNTLAFWLGGRYI